MPQGVLGLTPFFFYDDAAPWDPRFDPLGGMQLLTRGMATALAARGLYQEVVTMGTPGGPRDLALGPRLTVRARRLPVPPIPSKLEGYFGLVLAWGVAAVGWVARNRARLRREVAVVHAHCDGSGTAPWAGLTAARLLGVPLVVQIYSSRALTQCPTTRFERVVDPVSKRLEVRAARRAAALLTLTDKVRTEYVERFGCRPERATRLAYLTVDNFAAHDTPGRRAELTARFGLAADRPVVTYLGRIAAEKGVEWFVEMAARLAPYRPCTFVVCGDGPEREAVERLVDRHGLRDVFRFTGFLHPTLVPSLVALSAVGVVPSRYEELGLIILEFMTMRCPVVAFRVGGIGELIRNGETGLLAEPGDADGLAGAVGRLLRDPTLGARLAGAAADLPARRYGLGAAVDQLLGIYARLGAVPC